MSGPPWQVTVCPGAEQLAQAAAELIRDSIASGQGPYRIALAGGNTPKATYAVLAGEGFVKDQDWERVSLFFGDERCLPARSPESNFAMVQESLLQHVGDRLAGVHRIKGELGPGQAAAEYEEELRAAFAIGTSQQPRFDLILLGMGPDGHVCSLFPGLPQLRESKRLVVGVTEAPKPPPQRVTLTMPVINMAHAVVFLVAGQDKAAAVQAVFDGDRRLPAAAVRPVQGRLVWLLDDAAAAAIKGAAGRP